MIDRWTLMVACVLFAGSASAQTAEVIIESNDPAAHVFADTTWLGPAARSPFRVPAGPLVLRVVPSAAGTWGVPSRVVRIEVAAGDTVTVAAPFPHVYRVESQPEAEVVLESEAVVQALGRSPVFYRSDRPATGVFRIQRDGFAPVLVTPGDELWNLHRVTLDPLQPPTSPELGISIREGRRSRRWIDYAALGVATVSAVVAVHYKRKADRRFEIYQQTGDPTLRPAIDRYDRYSAVALGGLQVGVGVFAIRLALR